LRHDHPAERHTPAVPRSVLAGRPPGGSGLADRARIAGEAGSRGQQHDSFDHHGLGDQKPVERVIVDEADAIDRDAMIAGDCAS
jgi:hypothetical protein